MLPSSPRRFGPYICISILLITLFLSHSTHCIPPSQPRLGIFSDDFSFPFNMRLFRAQTSTPSNKNNNDNEHNPSASPNMFADIIPTAQNSNNNDNQTKDFGVDNLYEYALKSASFRDGKDVKALRKFLQQSNAQ